MLWVVYIYLKEVYILFYLYRPFAEYLLQQSVGSQLKRMSLLGYATRTVYSNEIFGAITHVLGRAAGSLRTVRAACTMAMGVATYPASA